MTFRIRLYDIHDVEPCLKSAEFSPNNLNYLCQDDRSEEFPILSELDPWYPMQYISSEMPQLISELEKVKSTLQDSQEISHVEKIISMCKECELNRNYIIVFSPFDISPES